MVIAGIVEHNWLGMVLLVPIVLVPILLTVLDASGPCCAGDSSAARAWRNFGACGFGAILTTLFALPAVLLRAESITGAYFGFWIAATTVGAVGSIAYFGRRSAD